MSSQQVGQYVAACGFADYEHLFKEHNVSGDRLMQLTAEDLRDMGRRCPETRFNALGDRLVMQQQIAGLRQGRRIAWRSDSFRDWEPLPHHSLRAKSSEELFEREKEKKERERRERREKKKSEKREMNSKEKDVNEKEKDLSTKEKKKEREELLSLEKSSKSDELRKLRGRVARAVRIMAAREEVSERQKIFRAWKSLAQRSDGGILSVAAARPGLTQLAALRAWAAAVALRRHEAELRAQGDRAATRSTAALAVLRNELRAVRCQGRRSACRGAQQRAMLALCGSFHAWRRSLQGVPHAPVVRGDVLLNSGEAAKRAQQQLQEAKKKHEEELNALKKQCALLQKEASDARMAAAAAARREARVEHIARKHEHAAKRGEELSALLACIKAWMGEVSLARSTAALQKEAAARVASAVDVVHFESRAALHAAWSDAAEAGRRAAALERRLEDCAASP